MTYISTIPVADTEGDLRAIYDAAQATLGYVPNYARVFSHRPDVYRAWEALGKSIRSHLDLRRYELVTLAAARALCSSYCMLAHASVLLKNGFDPDELARIVEDTENAGLSDLDIAIMSYAEKIVRDATAITADDINDLRDLGLTDPEIFDIASAAAARCFFSKMLDSLGTQADSAYLSLDAALRDQLVVGRPISDQSEVPAYPVITL